MINNNHHQHTEQLLTCLVQYDLSTKMIGILQSKDEIFSRTIVIDDFIGRE